MKQITYHIVTDQHNQYLNTQQEVKNTIEQWDIDEDSNIKIFRIITEEIGYDEIELDEEIFALDN